MDLPKEEIVLFIFGTQDYKIVGMISHLGPQLGVADGIALANKLQENGQITAVFTGEGGTSKETSMRLNVAAVWDLPVIFIVETMDTDFLLLQLEQFPLLRTDIYTKERGIWNGSIHY